MKTVTLDDIIADRAPTGSPPPVAGHTPGEWTVEWQTGSWRIMAENSEPVACVDFWKHIYCDTGHKPELEQEANARLIASAPRLARENQALREALEQLESIASLIHAKHGLGCDAHSGEWARLIRGCNFALDALSSPSQSSSTTGKAQP